MTTLINPGTTPQVYTEDGRMIAAGGRVEDARLDKVGQGAVDSGRLRLVDEDEKATKSPPEDTSPPAEDGPRDAESTNVSARRTTKNSS